MTRRGTDAKARARRQRAAVAIRSQSARRAFVVPPRPPASAVAETAAPSIPPASAAPSRPPRAPRRRESSGKPLSTAIRDAVEQLRVLVAERETATIAVDREVSRLHRLGATWPDIAGALGVSRQAARQKYTGRGSK